MRILTLRRLPIQIGQWHLAGDSPLTVARPRRIFTALPFSARTRGAGHLVGFGMRLIGSR
ncbi:hypothetical protein caldi_26570 [Caldinitratiruptor microaerophilus]|uniref:Uncharacterized protein n=1 Tax=Caldinitratiruptor microaerophilus TaxID=671077 RepID=A0AA35CLY1_9FIRM|nr:hypothetical protein caldi_26570 [Caldinitratiruptor microaerophilus]